MRLRNDCFGWLVSVSMGPNWNESDVIEPSPPAAACRGSARLLTSLSNWESGASPQSIPPPEDRELSEGEVMVWRLEP